MNILFSFLFRNRLVCYSLGFFILGSFFHLASMQGPPNFETSDALSVIKRLV